MASLTALGAGHGFTAGDLDTSGWVAVVPAYQKVYFADGRTYSATIGSSGYHKLDFLNTRIEAGADPGWTKGDVLTQGTSGATGIFDETIDMGGGSYWHLIYRTTTTEFIAGIALGYEITGGALTLDSDDIDAVVAPPHWLNWTVTDGTFPDGGSNIGCLCFGRIFLNSMLNPHQWACSRVADPLDWDTSQDDVAAATASQNAKAGEVGDPIVSMIGYKDHYLIWGCANQMWLLQSDPLMGGVNRCISKATGIFSPTAFCWDDKNTMFFMGSDGIYALGAESMINAAPPENITKLHNPKLVTSLGLNRRTDRVAMGYDKKRYGIKIAATQQDGTWSTSWWLDLRTGGIFPESFAEKQQAASLFYYDSYDADERGLLIGGYDGYIRTEDEAEKSDDGSNAIAAHVALGPIVADGQPREQVGITESSVVLGEESDGVTVEYHRADSADLVVDNVLNDETPFVTKTLTGDGMANSIIDRASGRAIAIMLRNETADETFSIESMNVTLDTEGLKKG